MSVKDSQRPFLAPDIMYFVTFILGMGGFWLSGLAASHLPHLTNRGLAQTLAMATTALVYGGLLAVWSVITSRRLNLKQILIAVVPAVLLGIAAAQVIVRLAAGKVTNLMGLGILTFVLFVSYGLIYVICLALARRLAR